LNYRGQGNTFSTFLGLKPFPKVHSLEGYFMDKVWGTNPEGQHLEVRSGKKPLGERNGVL
jgi:hypothetical protein